MCVSCVQAWGAYTLVGAASSLSGRHAAHEHLESACGCGGALQAKEFAIEARPRRELRGSRRQRATNGGSFPDFCYNVRKYGKGR